MWENSHNPELLPDGIIKKIIGQRHQNNSVG